VNVEAARAGPDLVATLTGRYSPYETGRGRCGHSGQRRTRLLAAGGTTAAAAARRARTTATGVAAPAEQPTEKSAHLGFLLPVLEGG
jgi:hypothetical protein